MPELVVQEIVQTTCTRTILLKHGHGHELPKDARTLLQTPQKVVTTEKCNGEYYYLYNAYYKIYFLEIKVS